MNRESRKAVAAGVPHARRRPTRAVLLALPLALALGLALAGCSECATDSPLSNAYRTPEALAAAALEALAAEDEGALGALLITREEYETLVWPALPDGRDVTFDFVWGISQPRNRKARSEVLEDFGGLPLELVGVDPGGDVETYDRFVLYKEAVLTVRRTDTGRTARMRFMDVLIEMDGGWKFMNFREG